MAARRTSARRKKIAAKASTGLAVPRPSARELAANRRRARALVRAIESKLDHIETAFYDVGVALQGLRPPAIWGALGAESFEALVGSIPRLGAPLAYRLLRIADHFTRKTAVALTQSKALALVTYVDATPADDDAETLAKKDARVGGTPLSEQTVRGILDAATEVRPAAARRKIPGQAEARKAVRDLEIVLADATSESVGARVVRRKGKFRAILDVPVDLVGRISIRRRTN